VAPVVITLFFIVVAPGVIVFYFILVALVGVAKQNKILRPIDSARVLCKLV
jgi:uncharacterized membrane protein YdjX (TVP38/TMEM64 family)